MDSEEFRVKAKEMVDYIIEYYDTVGSRRVYPDVQPGYLHKLLPLQAPQEGESWDQIFKDVQTYIMPGIVHWQSPHMHGYFPALTSYPSIMGELLSSSINVLCFTWASSPAGTELEDIAMNWLGKAIGLPDDFLNEKPGSIGGGVIQTTASEATLVSLLAARTRALIEIAKLNPEMQSSELLGHLVCYCSDQAHSSVEKAGLIGLVRMRYIESDENNSMRGDKLEEAILSDKEKGFVPFWVCATLGTTGTTAFDHLREVGEVCDKHSAWLHVDAAYAGNAFLCPEFRHWLDGIELADSFAFNPSKWLMVNFDCTAMWVKDSTALHKTFNVNPIYLRHENSGKAIDYMVGTQTSNTKNQIRMKYDVTEATGDEKITINKTTVYYTTAENGINDDTSSRGSSDDLYSDYNGTDKPCNEDGKLHGYNKTAPGCGQQDIQLEDPDKKERLHWQIPLSRRFRALKLWFVLRNYGIAGLQKHIRENVRYAQKFEALVSADPRFEIPCTRTLGLVVFRLKGENALTEKLLKRLNGRGRIHCVPACFNNIYVIRFTVTSPHTTNQTILEDWNEIKMVASEILIEIFGSQSGNIAEPKKHKVMLKEIRELNATFGTSLLLANSPMSPKVVNGTHVAICDYDQVLNACAQTFAQLKLQPKDSPEMRRRIRGMKMCGKKFSLDSAMDLVQGMVAGEDDPKPALPQCHEEDIENGSSPGDRSSVSSSPVSSIGGTRQELLTDLTLTNQLDVPPTPSRQYRSKSVDVALSGLKLDDARITIDMKNNEIIITPTASISIDEAINQKTTVPQLSEIEEKLNIGEKITQAFENFQDGLQMLNDYRQTEENVEQKTENDAKLTIKGPGSYIRKLIQQFSEGPFENEDPQPECERAISAPTIKERADAICKKCLHYKGRITK